MWFTFVLARRKGNHMTRRFGLLAVLSIVGSALIVPGAGAHTIPNGATSLTIGHVVGEENQAGRRTGHIYGRIKSSEKECKNGRKVRLTVKGEPISKSDITDREGEYRFRLSLEETERARVTFAGSTETSYGHSHKCAASKSRQITLKFPGSG